MGLGPKISGLLCVLLLLQVLPTLSSNEPHYEAPEWLKELNKTWTKESHSVFEQAEALQNDQYDDSFAFIFRIFFITFMCIFFFSFMCACRRACCGRRRIQAGAILSPGPGAQAAPTVINIHRNRAGAPGYGYTQVATNSVGGAQLPQAPGYPSPYATSTYGATTTFHYPAPGGYASGQAAIPQAAGFKDLPPPPPYESLPPQPGFNPAYPSYPQQPQQPAQIPTNPMPPPPSYSEKS